jgi:hypothetical protein
VRRTRSASPRRVVDYTSCPHCDYWSIGVQANGRIVRHTIGMGSVVKPPHLKEIYKGSGCKSPTFSHPTRQPSKEQSVSSTKESTAVLVKMDPQPERIEGGWKMLMFAEYDYPDYVAWSDATDFAAPPKDMTEKIGRALIMNRAPYKPGDTVREREEWMLSAFIDVGAQYGQVCDEENARSMKYVLQYRDDDGDWFTARTIWPRDKDYAEARKLVTCYADECRERPAEEMPAWAIRPRVVKSIEPVMRDGGWWWRVEV